MTLRSIVLTFFAVCAASVSLARAQCLDWRTFPRVDPDVTGTIQALAVHDDGTGPALYLGGDLHDSSSLQQRGVHRWNGSSLQPLSAVVFSTSPVTALVSFDDGTGPALYAANTRIAKWNGTSWQLLNANFNDSILQLIVHDDGSGPALYAGGFFTTISGLVVNGVAKWNGAAWTALGTGPSPGPFVSVFALASYDDGTGPALYAGGSFPSPTGSPNIRKWKSGVWSDVGSGTNSIVRGLVAGDDGSGPSLFAVGEFTSPHQRVARWDGVAWHPLGGGLTESAWTCANLDDGSGPKLLVSTNTGTGARVQRWDGSAWAELNPGTQGVPTCSGSGLFLVRALAAFDEGAGPHVFAGTTSGTFGSIAGILWRSNAMTWERIGTQPRGLDGGIRTMIAHDDGSGRALYAGGTFCRADESNAKGVGRWDGTSWHAVGSFFIGSTVDYTIDALASYNASAFNLLVVAARLSSPSGAHLSWWNGSTWTYGSPTLSPNDAFAAVQQFGPHLYIGGSFTQLSGVASPNIARWSPTTGYVAVGTGANAGVNALATYDDGTGLALYAGGVFTSASGVPLNRIGKWSGTSWSPLGSGMNAIVDALCVFDDGSGPALYAAGDFTTAGGSPALRVARWSGSSWSAVGAGLDAQVLSLGVFDDGSGAALYAGGEFTFSGTTPMRSIARWNGTTWTGVGGGIPGTVRALCAHDDGTGLGPQLFVGGTFTRAGALSSENFAAWRSCGGAISKFCFGDGSDGYCPCANQGVSGRGCNNSMLTGGARLNATGATNPDTIELYVAGELPNAATLVFQGTSALSSPLLFGGGLRCAGGTLVRLYTDNAVNGIVSVPGTGDPSISARSASQGDPLTPGAVRTYQAWYRDPVPNFCTPPAGNVWNLSNAVRIVW